MNLKERGEPEKTLFGETIATYHASCVPLNVYTHASYDRAAEQMAKILDFKESGMQGKQRKSG